MAYVLVLILVSAIFGSPEHDDSSWLLLLFGFVGSGVVMFLLVLLDFSGRRTGREPSSWVHPLQERVFSPLGLRLLCLGLFAVGVGSGFRAGFIDHSHSPSAYIPLAMGLGSVIALYLGERLVYGDQRDAT
jgi:hypothetical protein